jgi:hypothetical protein
VIILASGRFRDILPEHYTFLAYVVRTLATLEAPEGIEQWSACDLCRGFSLANPTVEHARGYFGCPPGVEHSWLVFRDAPHIVLDVHPIGGALPFLVTTEGRMNPWCSLYRRFDSFTADGEYIGTVSDPDTRDGTAAGNVSLS